MRSFSSRFISGVSCGAPAIVTMPLSLSCYQRSMSFYAQPLLGLKQTTASAAHHDHARDFLLSAVTAHGHRNEAGVLVRRLHSATAATTSDARFAAKRWATLGASGSGSDASGAYGSIAGDVADGGSEKKKPLEEEVWRNERLRRQQAQAKGEETQTAEEAQAEQLSSQVAGYNPWEVLGIKPGASNQTIRLRYHELMKEVHPDMAADGVGDIPRLNQINKAYELITKSPTLDKRYRNLVSDTQYFYYKFLPEWMARNVDEMPRYWSWAKWRTPGAFQIFVLLFACYALGRFWAVFPKLTTVFVFSVLVDVLFHTMIAPATLSMLFLYSIMAYRSYDMAWLTSPKGFLHRELGY